MFKYSILIEMGLFYGFYLRRRYNSRKLAFKRLGDEIFTVEVRR